MAECGFGGKEADGYGPIHPSFLIYMISQGNPGFSSTVQLMINCCFTISSLY